MFQVLGLLNIGKSSANGLVFLLERVETSGSLSVGSDYPFNLTLRGCPTQLRK